MILLWKTIVCRLRHKKRTLPTFYMVGSTLRAMFHCKECGRAWSVRV